MSKPILLIESNYHIGDNPGVFLPSTYVGIKIALPLTKTWIDETKEKVNFIISTTDIETWDDWKGHLVSINGTQIGRLKDPDDQSGKNELFDIEFPMTDFLKILNGSDSFIFEIELERQPAMLGFADDFTLRRISTKNIVARIGHQKNTDSHKTVRKWPRKTEPTNA